MLKWSRGLLPYNLSCTSKNLQKVSSFRTKQASEKLWLLFACWEGVMLERGAHELAFDNVLQFSTDILKINSAYGRQLSVNIRVRQWQTLPMQYTENENLWWLEYANGQQLDRHGGGTIALYLNQCQLFQYYRCMLHLAICYMAYTFMET